MLLRKKFRGNFDNAITEIGEGKKKIVAAEIQLWQSIAEIREGKKNFVAISAMPLPK